jgi:glycosyltransferase involved in cell wall biosynthesis
VADQGQGERPSRGALPPTTLHGRQDLPDLGYLYARFADMPLVSISDAQRHPIPHANFAATVLHGLPARLLTPVNRSSGDYLAFVGRISPEKRVDRAIEIARAAGLPLKIAAKVDKVDQAYFEAEVSHLLNLPGIEYIGEIDERGKASFLGHARALLFPIDWPEPFGLVMIEAMACGTPILAFNNGSVPEVIDESVTGIIVGSLAEAHARLAEVLALDRTAVRRRFEKRFTAPRMAADYVKVYERCAMQALSRRRQGDMARTAANASTDRLH